MTEEQLDNYRSAMGIIQLLNFAVLVCILIKVG